MLTMDIMKSRLQKMNDVEAIGFPYRKGIKSDYLTPYTK